MASDTMSILTKNKCIRKVSFSDFLTRMFRLNGLRTTIFSFWPNRTNPNAVGVFYGKDSSFCKLIGLSGLCIVFPDSVTSKRLRYAQCRSMDLGAC